jgi:hypothetical protein
VAVSAKVLELLKVSEGIFPVPETVLPEMLGPVTELQLKAVPATAETGDTILVA